METLQNEDFEVLDCCPWDGVQLRIRFRCFI